MITLCIEVDKFTNRTKEIFEDRADPRVILLYLPEYDYENVKREAQIAQIACEDRDVEDILEILRS